MSALNDGYAAVIVGGGFYGTSIAVYLARRFPESRILLVEKEAALCRHASFNNQARIHNGYHYPRSFTTAYRSRVNLPRFLADWPGAVKADFVALYAIARRNSKVTATQFQRFCRDIGASLQPVEPSLRGLFQPHLIEDVFRVEEYAFDANVLASWAAEALVDQRVETRMDTRVIGILRDGDVGLRVSLLDHSGISREVRARSIFNCTYSGLNHLGAEFPGVHAGLKHEIAEMALLRLPDTLRGVGITVMDGPFFSLMPFPARGLHTLSHVRYTPHVSWTDDLRQSPYSRLDAYPRQTRVDRMLRDVSRYLPEIARAEYVESLFEVKTVLTKNEGDDGRPILFERHVDLPGCYSILGGKIDNIYDVIERLETDGFLATHLSRREN